MRTIFLTFVSAFAGLVLMPDFSMGHHGWVDFDEKTELTVEGTVTRFYFVNPHCALDFDVKDKNGQIQKWEGEFSSKTELSRKGWDAASLQAGDKLTLTGHPAKNGALAIHVIKIRLANGEIKLGPEQSEKD